MKKKNSAKRRLLSAAGMLAISAAMLSSATFAWFSLNRTVNANLMTVEAKSADPFLKISANGTDYYTNLATAADSTTDTGAWAIQTQVTINEQAAADAKLKLIAPKTIGTTPTWVWNSSSDPANANTQNVATGTGNQNVTLSIDNANKNNDRSAIMTGTVGDETLEDAFVLQQTLSLKNISPSADAKNLKIDSVTITRDTAVANSSGNTSTFDEAVRVLVVNGSGEYALYDKNGLITTGAENGATGTAMTLASSKPVIAPTLAAGTSTDITIYMYFDGNATQAYTNNAFDLTGVHAGFTFTVDERTATTA